MSISSRPETIDISVIVAVYNEEPRNLTLLLERLGKAINPLKMSYEVLFVNDGSKDQTSSALRHISVEYPHIKLIELSRNFGQQAAITAGMDYASGDIVVNMDSDLQDPPELIPSMVQKWREGFDVVYATRAKRRDRAMKRLTAYLFYRLLGSVSSINIPLDSGDFRLLDRKVVEALRHMPEKTRFIRGLIPWLGFKQCGIMLERDARELGETAYTPKKLLMLALDGLLSFSILPLYAIPVIGFAVSAIGVLACLIHWVLSGLVLDNFALVCAMAVFTGIQAMVLGVVAVYLAKVLDEVRSRPTYVVGNKLGTGFCDEFTPLSREEAVRHSLEMEKIRNR